VNTYRLAFIILFEAFKSDVTGREIVLTATVSRMPRNTRVRAMNELVKLKLIKISRERVNQAARVTCLGL
jgi:hypothetical protein